MRLSVPPTVFGLSFLIFPSTTVAWTPSTLPFRIQRAQRPQEQANHLRQQHGTRRTSGYTVLAAALVSGDDKEVSQSMPPLVLYNSLTRCKEPFQPVQQQPENDDGAAADRSKIPITMYTCGPTVYDAAHIGNFRAFLTYDLLKRVLLYLGYTHIVHVCNITDVDDKILVRANQEGYDTVTELTRKWEGVFLNDLAALHCVPATVYPRATEHIPAMLRLVQDLAAQDLAYRTPDGSWYFDTQRERQEKDNDDGVTTSTIKQYGQQLVPQMKLEDMEEQKATENADGKKHFADFCVWKAYKEGVDRMDAAWESAMYVGDAAEEKQSTMIDQPWPLAEPVIALGRPGWHLECSAMARTYFGDTTLDFHGGGIDLKFPHHENEIAQSEGWSNNKFCNCWFHNGFVNMGDEKMSKSLGNFLTLADVCPTALDVRAYRYLIISSQYRNALNFSKKALNDAKKLIQRIDKVMAQLESLPRNNHSTDRSGSVLADAVVPKALASFATAIRDDLSMPRAAATLISVIKAVEQEYKRSSNGADEEEDQLDTVGLQAAKLAIEQMDKVFGILYDVPHRENESMTDTEDSASAAGGSAVPDEVMELVGQRSQAKDAKDWDLADSLRQRITELGFAVKDVKDGDPIVTPVEP